VRRGGSPPPSLPPPPAPLWTPGPPPDPEAVEALVRGLSLPRGLCGVLVARGYSQLEEAKGFLRPLLDDLHPPELLAGATEAARRILAAMEDEETILVHGDYDVDGIAGAAILTRYLRRLGARVVPFVPHRLRHGYDLGPGGVDRAVEVGATLLITVDSGIGAHAAVERANALGIDVVVTDHHTPGPSLPPAVAVVNPNRRDCPYPDKGLSGAGVAFKLCQLLGGMRGMTPETLLPLLDLVALATVADLVPLSGENRILVRYGLRAIRETREVGLQALLHGAGLGGKEVEAGEVGFVLAPRINAAGRMGDADDGLRLLLCGDAEEARGLALGLELLNRERREEEARTLEEALALLAAGYDPERDHGVVLAGEGWHPGVIGIVASRVVERIHRPVVLVAMDGERGRGSARSVPGFHLYEAVAACGGLLDRFGGHRQAAGMDLRRDRLPGFRAAFAAEARRRLQGHDLRPVIRVDLELPLAEATPELLRYLRYLGPHGIGNPRPVFLARRVELTPPPRVVGDGHLKLRLRENGASVEAIGFRMAERFPPEALEGSEVDVLFHLQENEYRGVRRVQARLLDLRPTGAFQPAPAPPRVGVPG